MKLVKLTQDGRVEWTHREEEIEHKLIDDIYVDDIFTTRIKNVVFKLTKYAVRTIRIGVFGRVVDCDPKGFHTYIKLEIIHDDSIVFTFPYTNVLWDLLTVVKTSTIDIDTLLDYIINENID